MADASLTCKAELLRILEHLHAGQFTPLVANKSLAFIQDKNRGKPGLLGQRILHLYCTFWRNWYAARFGCSLRNDIPVWADYGHAYLASRRREGAMAVQAVTQEQPQRLQLSAVVHLRDMTNAFASTAQSDRSEALAELVSPVEERQGNVPCYHQYLVEKLTSSVVEFQTDDGSLVSVQTCRGHW